MLIGRDSNWSIAFEVWGLSPKMSYSLWLGPCERLFVALLIIVYMVHSCTFYSVQCTLLYILHFEFLYNARCTNLNLVQMYRQLNDFRNS